LRAGALHSFGGIKFDMASLSKFVAVSFTTFSLFAPILASLSKPAFAEEMYLDNSCRQNQRLPELDKFVVFYKSEFRANNQTYWLSAARYQDGAAILCISRPNFNQPRPVSEFPVEFISNITKDPKSNGVFSVRVHEGNGPAAPITVYRLDVTNPNRPVVRQQSTTRRSRF
jgi:hypothetical protein